VVRIEEWNLQLASTMSEQRKVAAEHVPAVIGANTLGNIIVVKRETRNALEAEAHVSLGAAARGRHETAVATVQANLRIKNSKIEIIRMADFTTKQKGLLRKAKRRGSTA